MSEIFNSGKKIRKMSYNVGVPVANSLLIYILSAFILHIIYINRVELSIIAFFGLNSTGDEALLQRAGILSIVSRMVKQLESFQKRNREANV